MRCIHCRFGWHRRGTKESPRHNLGISSRRENWQPIGGLKSPSSCIRIASSGFIEHCI
jgi:hypothetical protein